MIDLSSAPHARLVTAFGTVLYVDAASGELRHGAIETSPANAFFVADQSVSSPYRRGFLVYDSGESLKLILCGADSSHCASRPDASAGSTSPIALELIPLERGLIAFTAANLFLSAIPDGRVSLSGPRCSTWELFLASEDWCSEAPTAYAMQVLDITPAKFDKKRIESYIVHPLTRVVTNTKPKAKKVLIYGYTKWSHGRVYYDLCTHLHRRGYIVDILDWQVNHADYIKKILPYYDLFLTALDGVRTLADIYSVPYERIIAVSHHEFDIRMLIEQKGMDVFDKFGNYGVVSEYLYCTSLMRGVTRAPKVASLGINYSEFHADIPERLATVGYASSMSVKTYGVEWKRGELAEAAAHDAGLAFKVAGWTGNQISFHDMPDFYKAVDAVLTSSISEAAQLPVMEAAAAGRLVIGTPVGNFPQKAYQGGGIIAPVEAEKFKTFAAATLRYYKENPEAYVAKCREIQNAAKQFDWQNSIDEWVELIQNATITDTSRIDAGGAHRIRKELDSNQSSLTNAQLATDAPQDPRVKRRLSDGLSKKGIICDLDWLSSYIAHEHYYLIMLLQTAYGFDIINSTATDFRSSKIIEKLNTYDALLIAYQGNVDIPVEQISTYKIFRVDDFVHYNEYDQLLPRLIRHSDMIISPYAYAFHQHFEHNNVKWLPYSSAIEGYSGVSFNNNPLRKILVSGSIAEDRPFRQYAASLNSEHIEVLHHPGYDKHYDRNSEEIVRGRYYRELNKYLCGFTDAHTYRYLHLKAFEIASVGSLLLADKLIEREMNELGFVDHETCIFADQASLIEKISWICDQKNRENVDNIRHAGMELVKERHLTRHRAKQLNEMINRAIPQKNSSLGGEDIAVVALRT